MPETNDGKQQLLEKHPRAIRWMHWINFPVLSVMIWSGLLIYWGDSIPPYQHAHQVYRIGIGSWTLVRLFPDWFWNLLNAPYQITTGLGWHFLFMWFFALNGIAYAIYLAVSGEWRVLWPKKNNFIDALWVTLYDLHVSAARRRGLPMQEKYNGAQKIAYTVVVLMGAGSLITGLAIYKPTQAHWLTSILGGYEMARWEHFWLTMGFCGFFLVHVVQVALAGWNNFRAMVSGYELKKQEAAPVDAVVTRRERVSENIITPKISNPLSKVPEVVLGFWIIKILATTLGETGGDMLSMSMNLGYAVSTLILFVPFLVLVAVQIKVKRFHAFLYWGVIVGTTLAGTTMADFADRSLHIGYPGGSSILFALVIASLLTWKWAVGTVSVNNIVTPKQEIFYWVTILFSNTLGTALGDWTSEGTGFAGGVALFSSLLAVIALLYFFTRISRTVLFWMAFILTRPLGASLGDLLTKPHDDNGLNLSRYMASGVIAVVMIACIMIFPQKAGEHPGSTDRL